jgi:hypothetical protein
MLRLTDLPSRRQGTVQWFFRLLAISALLMAAVPLMQSTIAQSRDTTATEIYARYQDVDLDYFFASSDAPRGHPLYRGLKAKLDGHLDDAERALQEATRAVPDSLRPFVYERLLAINERTFDWDGVVRYKARVDTGFTSDSALGRTLATRPVPRLEMPRDTAVAPFGRLRTEARFNGRDRAVPVVLDTGAPKTSVSQSFAEAYDLPVDTSVVVGRSVVPALNINAPKYPTRIDRMTIGGVVLKDIPATVTWTDPDSSGEQASIENTDVFLGARILRHFFDEIRYSYADSTFSMIRGVPERNQMPNFAIMSDGWPIVRAEVDGESMAGVIDTGNLWVSRLHASSFPPSDYPQVGTRSGTAPNGYQWEVGIYQIPLTFPGDLRREEMVIRGSMQKPYRLQANFGPDLWTGGTLVLDFQNRRAYYEGGEQTAPPAGR